MKRIVFLLCMMIMAVSVDTSLGATETLSAELETVEGVKRLVIEGTAHHPFRIVRGDENNQYRVNGMRHGNGMHVVYGFAMLERTTSYYDGFFIVFDDTGAVISETTIDYDHLEEVRDVHISEEAFYVHLRQSIDKRPESVTHRKDFLLSVNDTTDILYEQDSEIRRVLYEREALYFSDHHQGGFEKAFHVREGLLKEGEIHGLEDQGQYRGALEIHSLCGTSTFEGEVFERSLVIDYPGHYTVHCDGEAYEFTMHPTIEGVALHETSDAPVRVDVSGGRVWLNDDLYVNGTIVDRPGYYTIKIEGANGYEEAAYFTLESGLEGVRDGGVYSGAKTVFFSGQGFLNEEPITSGHSLEESGLHTLKVIGEGDYEETVSFEILSGSRPPIENLFRFEILLAVGGVIITGGFLYLFLRKR